MSLVSRLQTHRKTVLIVDDDEFIVDHLEIILKSLGYQVRSARNGVEGLACATRYDPDCVLLDLSMPELDGFGFLRHKTKIPRIDRIPIIVLSSNHTRADVQLALALGAVDYLVKPIDAEKLSNRMFKIVPSPFYNTPETTSATWGEEGVRRDNQLPL
jgi:CheY-like chemotaxis protein